MIGARVRLAREFCGHTQHELADLAGVPLSAIGDIEAGRRIDPSADIIEAVAAVTGFPPSYFYRQIPLPDLPEGHYRKRARGASKQAKQIRAQTQRLSEEIQSSVAAIGLPPVTIQQKQPVASLDEIEALATEVRGWIGVGSRDCIPNLMRAAERAGIVVVRLPNQMDDYDSYSAWPDPTLGGRPVIVLTDGHPGDRDRFNVGHELGHLILHSGDRGIDPKSAELQAHRFAGALLLPKAAAKPALRQPLTLRTLMDVKATFGISIAAAARRALDLGYITRTYYVSLQKQLSNRKWRKQEPVDVPQEQHLLIRKIIDAVGGEGTAPQIAERIELPMFWLNRLLNTAA